MILLNRYDDTETETQQRSAVGGQKKRTLILLAVFLAVLAAVLLLIRFVRSGDPQPTGVSGEAGALYSSAEPDASTASPAPPDTPAVQTTAAPETQTNPPSPSESEPPAPVEDESWKLILVNATHPLPENYTVTLKELRYGHRVDERIYPELQQMFDDARAAGIFPLINESYRTGARQQEIMDKYIAGYEAEGLSHEEAVKKARQIVALPGTSEHELGLALDIIAEFDGDSTATWNWLKQNSWRYGFILRYPADKVEITGINYEPWHFRYVGCPAAQEITEQGLCLEEYLAQNN